MTNFFTWFRKSDNNVPSVKFVYSGMDLEMWRKDPQLLAFARDLWGKVEWQHALSALKNAAPSGFPIRGKSITETEANIELGRKEGYQDCMNALFSLTVRAPEPFTEVEADFDPKDYSKADE